MGLSPTEDRGQCQILPEFVERQRVKFFDIVIQRQLFDVIGGYSGLDFGNGLGSVAFMLLLSFYLGNG
jgi:hypothetical protein